MNGNTLLCGAAQVDITPPAGVHLAGNIDRAQLDLPTWGLMLLPALRRQGNAVIAMTGRPQSTLALEADVHLDVSVPAEACPLHPAPTSSTTATPSSTLAGATRSAASSAP